MFGNIGTVLAPEEEAAFRTWRESLPANLQNMSEYDLRGAWRANARSAANGHLPDTWKLPNHITFATGSQYSGPGQMGGLWADATPDKPDEAAKSWVFWASPTNVQHHSLPEMADYFRQYEPDSSVVFPLNYRLPAR
jgi:hypothetical protein